MKLPKELTILMFKGALRVYGLDEWNKKPCRVPNQMGNLELAPNDVIAVREGEKWASEYFSSDEMKAIDEALKKYGWRVPTEADWEKVSEYILCTKTKDRIYGNLRLAESGYKDEDGITRDMDGFYYWSAGGKIYNFNADHPFPAVEKPKNKARYAIRAIKE